MTETEVLDILVFVQQSHMLEELWFEDCLLPLTFSLDLIPAEMQSRDIKVFWNDYGYSLNLQSGVWEVDNVDTIKRICTENVTIFRDNSELLQKCTIQLLENASYYDIPITCLHLNKTFKECVESNIVLHSGLTLNSLSTLENIQIVMETDKEMQEPRSLSEEEIKTIFKYVLRCRAFKKLSFDYCLLPPIFSLESIPAEMQSRDIKVIWNDFGYSLNLQSGVWEVDDVHTVKRLCTEEVGIVYDDSELLQRCTIKLLENASYHDITISCLYLNESFSNIDAGDVILHSGLRLPCPVSVKEVVINTVCEGREMTETEVVDILMFVKQSHLLKTLKFWYCLLPQYIPAESIPSILKSRNVEVSWWSDHDWLELNLQFGRWMNSNTRQEIRDTEYNDTVREFREKWRYTEWQKARVASEKK